MTTEQLIASLTATHASDDEGIETSDGYVDWSSRDGARTAFEIGDADGAAVVLWLTDDDLAELHRRLTVTLLARAAG